MDSWAVHVLTFPHAKCTIYSNSFGTAVEVNANAKDVIKSLTERETND